MIEAGLNVVAALVILEEQTEDTYFADIVAELRADVEGGMLLSQAMARHPKVFDRLYVAMVRRARRPESWTRCSTASRSRSRRTTQIKRRVKGAMLYPTMVLMFATLVLCRDAHVPRPGLREDLRPARRRAADADAVRRQRSNLLRNDWYIIFPPRSRSSSGSKYKKTEPGRQMWDRIKLRVPMKIGDVVLKVTMARFSRTLSTLVAAGVDIIKALEITGHDGRQLGRRGRARRRAPEVHEGVPIAQPLIENPIFPPMVSQMVKIGEETGELEKMLGEDRRLLRGRGRRRDLDADLDHRAADDDRRRDDGRRDHHLHVPADVQDAHARQVDGGFAPSDAWFLVEEVAGGEARSAACHRRSRLTSWGIRDRAILTEANDNAVRHASVDQGDRK